MSPKITDEQREQRRHQLLNAAKLVFIRKGYEPATMKDFVEEAGMSRGWIYLYFQTKEDIFEALMEQQDLEYEWFISEALKKTASVWEIIDGSFTQLKNELMFMTDSILPTFYEYYLTGWRDEQRRMRLVSRYESGIARFVKLLQLGVDRGEFIPSMPLDLIGQITSSYQEGIMTHTLAVGAEKANTEQQLSALSTYLRQLLGIPRE